MDKLSKNRLTGAVVWLVLLIIIVPSWYSNPVYFKPENYQPEYVTAERPVVGQLFEATVSEQRRTQLSDKQASRDLKNTAKSSIVVPIQAKSYLPFGVDKVISSRKPLVTKSKQWIVRIVSYKNMKAANQILGKLEKHYKVSIKTFKHSGIYSVRAGPYLSKSKAEQDSQKLDKILHIRSEVVQLN